LPGLPGPQHDNVTRFTTCRPGPAHAPATCRNAPPLPPACRRAHAAYAATHAYTTPTAYACRMVTRRCRPHAPPPHAPPLWTVDPTLLPPLCHTTLPHTHTLALPTHLHATATLCHGCPSHLAFLGPLPAWDTNYPPCRCRAPTTALHPPYFPAASQFLWFMLNMVGPLPLVV